MQENCIDLVGRIADRGPEHVSAREWMRICFELLEMLKAHKKAIRRAAVNTFGYIAKAIGPQDVLHTLLNNLKVGEKANKRIFDGCYYGRLRVAANAKFDGAFSLQELFVRRRHLVALKPKNVPICGT